MDLTDTERLIMTIKHQNNTLLHVKEMLDNPQNDNERATCVQTLSILCNNIPILESKIWNHLGMTYDEVVVRRNIIMEERRRLKMCKCGHSKAEHKGLLECLMCSCSNFLDPSGWQ